MSAVAATAATVGPVAAPVSLASLGCRIDDGGKSLTCSASYSSSLKVKGGSSRIVGNTVKQLGIEQLTFKPNGTRMTQRNVDWEVRYYEAAAEAKKWKKICEEKDHRIRNLLAAAPDVELLQEQLDMAMARETTLVKHHEECTAETRGRMASMKDTMEASIRSLLAGQQQLALELSEKHQQLVKVVSVLRSAQSVLCNSYSGGNSTDDIQREIDKITTMNL